MTNSLEQSEPILTDNGNNRFYLFPIVYKDIYEFYKRVELSHWFADEINLNQDNLAIPKLHPVKKHIIEIILGFFAAADGIVNENLATNFADEVKIPEARAFYTFQERIETVHQETYFKLLNVYVEDDEKKQKLFRSIENNEIIKKKADWAFKWMNRDAPFAQRIFAFACVEGIHFASSFATIYWFKKNNELPGLCLANEFILRDETSHWEFAALLYSHLKYTKLSPQIMYQIMTEAVDLEIEFIHFLLGDNPLIGLNTELMSQYVKSLANDMIHTFDHSVPPLYPGVTNPLDYMNMSRSHSYSNFFEKKSTEYTIAIISDNLSFGNIDHMDF